MKLTAVSVFFPVLIQGAVVPVDRPFNFGTIVVRQDPAMLDDGIPSRKLAKLIEIPPQSGIPGAKRIKAIYGPFKTRGPGDKIAIPGTFPSMDPGGTSYNFHLDSDFPRDITVLLAQSAILSSDFKRTTLEDKIYNHHNAFMETVKEADQIYECENGVKAKNPPSINLFAGTSTEKIEFNFTSASDKIKTGFYIGKDSKLQNVIDLVNMGPTRDFYSDNEIEYLPGKPAGYLNVKQTMVNPDTCGGDDGYAIHPPAGKKKFTVESKTIVMKESGWLVRSRGHLHDGGNAIILTVNGKVACKSEALYGGPGFEFKGDDGKTFETINKSTECIDPILLKKGDKLHIFADFDLDKHPSRPMGGGAHIGMKAVMDGDAEQMAIMFINFAKVN